MVVQRTTAVPALFDVKKHGAKGDGSSLDTAAIQRAIDACTVGCKVLLPKGTYKSGALYLKSNMTLEIAEGATLLGSERAEDYPREGYIQYPYSTTVRPASLINALPRDPRQHQAFENIRIVGKGTIDGNGWKRKADAIDERGQPLPVYLASDNTRYMLDGLLAKAQVERAVAEGMNVKDAYGQMRSSLITLRDVKNVFYGGFTVLNPAYHGIMNLETENVVLANTTHKTYDANNGDGIEFANSRGRWCSTTSSIPAMTASTSRPARVPKQSSRRPSRMPGSSTTSSARAMAWSSQAVTPAPGSRTSSPRTMSPMAPMPGCA